MSFRDGLGLRCRCREGAVLRVRTKAAPTSGAPFAALGFVFARPPSRTPWGLAPGSSPRKTRRPMSSSLELKEKLFRKFRYRADRRVKTIEKMSEWEFGKASHDKACSVFLQIGTTGDVVVEIRGDAPLDPEVQSLVGRLGGHIYLRTFNMLLRNRIAVDVSSDFGAIVVLSAALKGLPERRSWGPEKEHYYYEAPRAADYLMQAYQALVEP